MGKVLPTLQKRHDALASGAAQQTVLAQVPLVRSFPDSLAEVGLLPLTATGIEVLQINVGKKCNQTCHHCHVDAGPDRTEMMPDDVVDATLDVLASTDIPTLDITGGAPELHKRFDEMVIRARELDRKVMDRCNLTITQLPNYRYLPEFLAEHQVEVVASLPYFKEGQTDAQRGDGVFQQSIQALKDFNAAGYGDPASGLVLNLVTNPVGAFLPGDQEAMEVRWRRELRLRFGIEFNHLFTITNLPISRFLEYLRESGNLEAYMTRLVNAFNPTAAANVMCRNTLSVGWDGVLYDCDFNQMLELPVHPEAPQTIHDFHTELLEGREIAIGPHCFGCTAGAGSSCGGAVT
ncbi:MAG: arsenosugar biosynthesis radical SAM (seleno)protein ArsS [Gemmatimonadota bacterium]